MAVLFTLHNFTTLEATKKCPACGYWSNWQQLTTDQCERCGQLLDPQRLRSEQEREALAQRPVSSLMLIEIKPDDKPLVRFFKHLIRGGQLAFGALMAFVLWLVTILAG
ncbi:hypothetical protein [Hymenobacter perfusus]|uniref:Uncharacterized protein n=1 Tax=Hymenobacter perfusus TaxID=1236770 RepID=A0A428KDP2_9BACT|nr:hypothetical protein [Hymenobacter perfusus]RSK44567.1 hypothetical protein EI293_08615 [Hymenobacter perfusus]